MNSGWIRRIRSFMRAGIFCLAAGLCVRAGAGETVGTFLKAVGTPVDPKVTVSWNRYNDSVGLADIMRRMAAAYPGLLRMETIGESYEGRDLWLLTVTDFSVGEPAGKPAVYMHGNMHGNEVQGSEFALYLAWLLTESREDTAYIRNLLRRKVFYIVPTLNPDARDYFIHQANTAGSARGSMMPREDTLRSGPGRRDGFDDLNGDGHITQMRWKDPYGAYIEDPAEPRRMIRLPDGEFESTPDRRERAKKPDASHYNVTSERMDVSIVVDEYDYDLNRDWLFDAGGAVQSQPVHPETTAARGWLMRHSNIVAGLSLHNFGGAIVAAGTRLNKTDPQDPAPDIERHAFLGHEGTRLWPGYSFLPRNDRLYSGTDIDWMYRLRGAYAFTVELMTSYLLYDDEDFIFNFGATPKDSTEQSYRFNDELAFGDAFVPWQPVRHPILGMVEVGGFKKNFHRLHPGFLLEADAHRFSAFAIRVAEATPDIRITDLATVSLSGGRQEVRATVVNDGALPTHSEMDLRHRISRPDYVMLETHGTIISGEVMGLPAMKLAGKSRTGRVELKNIPGKSAFTVKWIVKGGDGRYAVSVDSLKGGRVSKADEPADEGGAVAGGTR